MTKEHWQEHPNQRRVTDIEREEIEKLFRLNVPFRNIRSEVTDSTGKVLTDNDLRNIALQQKQRNQNLKILTSNEKYNALKVVFDQISNLLCLSGQKEFNDNLAFFEKHLE